LPEILPTRQNPDDVIRFVVFDTHCAVVKVQLGFLETGPINVVSNRTWATLCVHFPEISIRSRWEHGHKVRLNHRWVLQDRIQTTDQTAHIASVIGELLFVLYKLLSFSLQTWFWQ